jgi:hypothetical protein
MHIINASIKNVIIIPKCIGIIFNAEHKSGIALNHINIELKRNCFKDLIQNRYEAMINEYYKF